MRELLPPAVEGSARIDRPPLDRRAPRTKSSRPPVPLTWRPAEHLGIGLSRQIHRQHGVDRDEVSICAEHPDVVRVADRREPELRAAARPIVDPRTAERGGAHHGPGDRATCARPVRTPASCRSATSSLTSPPCRPRSRRSRRLASTAAGTLPMPIWIVSPSSIRPATCVPIRWVSAAGRPSGARPAGGPSRPRSRDARTDLVAMGGSRHGGIDLGHDRLGPLQRRRDEVHRYAEAAPAGAIRRRDLNQGEIDLEPRQVVPDAAVVQRHEPHLAGRMGARDRAEHEERGEPGVGVEGRRVDPIDPGNEAADVVHAIARLRRRRERLQQRGRLAARALHEHGHAGAQQIGQTFGADLAWHRAPGRV